MKKVLAAGIPLFVLCAQEAGAMPFGTFDPRSMAMGGAGVAAGTSANASFFNPALLAAAKDGEDFSLELPILGVRVADPDEMIKAVDDFQNADHVTAFADAVDAFNANPNPFFTKPQALKDQVRTTASDLIAGLQTLSNKAVQGELIAGTVIAIPSRKFGAALQVSGRAMGGALLDVADSDVNNFQAVIDGVTANDPAGIVDSFGDLVDFSTDQNMNSSVQGRGVALVEVGVAMAREFTLAGKPYALGITPKFMRVSTFDYSVDVNSADITIDEGERSYSAINFDLGVARDYGNGWKAGLVVKNVVPKDFETALGNTIEFKPQARAGVAYGGKFGVVTADIDLNENDPAGFDGKTQYAAFGAELNAWNLFQFRIGYRHNLSDSDTSSASAGIGLSPFGVHIDLAVAGSGDEIGGGLQLGFRF